MKKLSAMRWVVVVPVWLVINFTYAQELPLVLDKPGTFEILRRTDYVNAACGFAKTDVAGNLVKISQIVEVMKKHPVLEGMMGFNGRVRLYNVLCDGGCGYGVPARISFEFSSFFRLKNGNIVSNAIEPPEWSLYINKISSPGFGFAGNNTSQGLCYLTASHDKKTIAPGIDLYDDELFVLYNPSRPPYWVPVTVGEAFAAARKEMEKEKDEVSLKYLQDFFEKEYQAVPLTDHNKPAYFGGGISRVSATPGIEQGRKIFPPIVKVNPAYFNKNLSKSAIQIIYFNLPQNKRLLAQTTREYLNAGSTSYHLALFKQEFDMQLVFQLATLVGK